MYCLTQGLTCDKLVFYLVRRFNYSYLLCTVETVARHRLYGPGWLRKGLNYIRTQLVKGIVCHICLFVPLSIQPLYGGRPLKGSMFSYWALSSVDVRLSPLPFYSVAKNYQIVYNKYEHLICKSIITNKYNMHIKHKLMIKI